MMQLVHTVGSELLAGSVAVAAACRLIPMNWHDHKPEWLSVYLAMFIGAIVTLFYDTPINGPRWSTTTLLVACAMYLWFSRHTWTHGAPKFMSRDAVLAPFRQAMGEVDDHA